MNHNNSPLTQWLAEISAEANGTNDVWDPGFDGNRQVVVAKLGPLQKIFQRPPSYKRRFYHHVYPLPIEDWQLRIKTSLYDGLCTLDATLSIRFQATARYASLYYDKLSEINRHIKSHTEVLIKDAFDLELERLDDGAWIDSGLPPVAKRIQTRINEAMILQHIQCRTICELHPSFKDVKERSHPNDPFTREDIYLKVLKKNFEFQEREDQERFQQEQELEQKRLEQQLKTIEQRDREDQLKFKEQALKAETDRRLLEEKEGQLAKQLLVEERLHKEQVRHQARLKELEQEAFREAERRQHAQQLETEQQLLEAKLAHQQALKDRERAAELEDFKQQQAKWDATKERMQLEKIAREKRLQQIETEAALKLREIELSGEQQVQEKLHQEKLKHESRMREIELELQVSEQKKRYESTQATEEYLRRDIELLILEKQRTELLQAVKKAKTEESQPIRQLPPGPDQEGQ